MLPVAENAVHVFFDGLCHRLEFGNLRCASRLAPVLEKQPRPVLVLRERIDAAKLLLHAVHVRKLAESASHLPQSVLLPVREILQVLHQRVALALDDLLYVLVESVHRPSADLVKPVVHGLDEVEVVVDYVRIRQECADPVRIGVRHVHADVPDAPAVPSERVLEAFQGLLALAVADVQHVSGLGVPHDRDVPHVRLRLREEMHLVYRDRLDLVERDVGELPRKAGLLGVLHLIPRKSERLSGVLDRHGAPEGHDRPRELLRQPALLARQERDLLHVRLAAVRAVDAVDREDNLHGNVRVRDPVDDAFADCVGRDMRVAADRTAVLRPLHADENPGRLPAVAGQPRELRQLLDVAPVRDQILPDHLKSIQLLGILCDA